MAFAERPPLNPNAANAAGEQLGRRLDSWKEIASWFDRSEKTVRRWEQREGLPVHRLLHEKRGTVYAYSRELEFWRQSRNVWTLEEESGPLNVTDIPHSANGDKFATLSDDPVSVRTDLDLWPQVTDGGEERSRIECQQQGWRRFRRSSWLMLVAGAVLLLSTFTLIVWHRNAAVKSLVQEPRIGSVAVLPLIEIGADHQEDYFADGMTEELITELGRLGSIRIISRTSIMQFKSGTRSLQEIGRQLNVDALVEGTVRRSGNRVRITVKLVRASPEHLILADAYESDIQDVMKLQRDVAQDIARNIQTKLVSHQAPGAAPYKRVDPETHEDYLRGRYFLAKRTAEAMNIAAWYFQRSIQRDPQYAPAYASLAWTYDILGSYEVLPPVKAFLPAIEFANKALQPDNTLSEAYTARAVAACFYELNWVVADRDFRHAIALDPSSALAHHGYGEYFASVGNAERAISELKIARRLDPLSLTLFSTIGRMYREAHQYDEAVYQCKQALVLDPNFSMGHWCLGQAYMAKRQFAEAISELSQANESGTTPLVVCDLGCAYAASGRKMEARAILKSLEKRARFNYVSPYLIASIYSSLGEKDQAFKWLEKAFDGRDGVSYLAADPMMDPLRSDPRFVILIQRLHLPLS
jgi:TolB-like protein/Tfp pilus assembly protein PilF